MKIAQPFIRPLAVLLTAGTIFSSCSKDEDSTPPPAEPAPFTRQFFVNMPVTITTTGSGNYEYGMKFSVTQNGKVTRLASRMPQAGNYRVTLWDASASPKTVLATATITQAAGALTFQAITPVSLVTGKEYLISVWHSGQWYEIRPLGAANFTYPITIGSISISGYQWVSSVATPQTFPTNAETTYVAGMADFEFQPD